MVAKGKYIRSSTAAKKTAGRASKSSSQWPNLPADVLQLIANQYLDIFDAHSLTAVCKDWNLQSSSLLHPPEPEPPWLLSRDLSKLYESRYLSNYKPCVIKACARGKKLPDCYGQHPVASKLGWLLMENVRRVTHDRYYFLWSPFTRGKRMKILDLPPMETGYLNRFLFATFSCSPYSPECVVFGANYEPRISKDLVIRTCRLGDGKWKKHLLACKFRQEKEVWLRSIVYMEQHQVLYCLFEDGSLGAFCPTDNSWNLLIDAGEMFDPLVVHYGDCLLESGGELLLVCRSQKTNGGTRILKFDPCKVAWVEQDRLADRVLFLCDNCSPISVAATGRMAALAGRIYVLDFQGLWCIDGDSDRKARSDDPFSSEVSEQCLNWGLWIMPPYATHEMKVHGICERESDWDDEIHV